MLNPTGLTILALLFSGLLTHSEETAPSELPPPEVTEKYFNLSTEDLKKLAEGGDVEASIDLGWRYFIGERSARDNDKAYQWFQVGADQGSHRAMTSMAQWYVVQKKWKEAHTWHEKAIKQGSIESLVGIGFLYFHGLGVEQNRDKSLEYYKQALDKDHPKAHNNIAYLYQNGIEVEQDLDKARTHFEKAAKGGNPPAMNSLGQMYASGKGVAQDYEKAFEYFAQGARHGFPGCQANLAMLYLNGIGVKKDKSKGEKLLEKAASQHNLQAARILADTYYQGVLLEKDLPKALRYFERAAALGDIEAMLQIAWMLNEGEGVAKPERKAAIGWAEIAKKFGHPQADQVLARLRAQDK